MFDRLNRALVDSCRHLLHICRPSGALECVTSLFLYTYRPSGAFLCWDVNRKFYAKR